MYAMRPALPSGEPGGKPGRITYLRERHERVNRDGLPRTLECYLSGPERTLG